MNVDILPFRKKNWLDLQNPSSEREFICEFEDLVLNSRRNLYAWKDFEWTLKAFTIFDMYDHDSLV